MNHNITHALNSLLASVDYQPDHPDCVDCHHSPTALASSMPLADMATAVMAAQANVLIDIHGQRTGTVQRARIDRRAASLAMAANNYLQVNDSSVNSWDPLTGYYRTKDQHWVYCHTNFAHHRDGLLALVGASNDRSALSRGIALWQADELEQQSIERGLCVTRLRTKAQWYAHPQYAALQDDPVIKLTRIGDSDRVPLPPSTQGRPLSGVRMLDLSRVIAGPMAGRTMAEHGSTVMLVSGPQLPAIDALVIDTSPGKRSTFLDLSRSDDRQQLMTLIEHADVFLDGFRPNALARFGITPSELAKMHPGLIYISISAFAEAGPWAGRRGYDTFVQASTGLAKDNGSTTPDRLPCQPLDYMTGYLSAFGAMVALRNRASQGGSWHVEMSLARTANWVWEMSECLTPESDAPSANPHVDDVADLCYSRDTQFGHVTALSPVIDFSETRARFVQPPVPLGTHQPDWPT